MKFYKEKNKHPIKKDYIIHCQLIDNIYLTVFDKFTDHTEYMLFNNIVNDDFKKHYIEFIPTDELLNKTKNLLELIKTDIKDFDYYISYLKHKIESVKDIITKEVYEMLHKENINLLSYRLKRVTVDSGINICYIKNAEEFELVRNYFFPKNIQSYEPKLKDFVKYNGNIFSIEKIDKKIVLQNIKDIWFSDKIDVLKESNFLSLIKEGKIEQYKSEIPYHKIENIEAILVRENGQDNSFILCKNVLTEVELDYLSEHEDIPDDDLASELYNKLSDERIFDTQNYTHINFFCEINNIKILEEISISVY